MTEVSVFDAKNQLSALLDRVARGEEVTITRRGKPVARLVPTAPEERAEVLEARMAGLQARIAARGERFDPDELQAWRADGRR